MTIQEVIEDLQKAAAQSPWGSETVVYLCETEREYIQLREVKLDKDEDGAVALFMIEEV